MKTLVPKYLGKKYLENYQRISIKTVLDKVEKQLKKQLLEVELEGINIIYTKANLGGKRAWFECPDCKNKAFILYNINGKLTCRKCSKLNYKKQRFKGMIEGNIPK